MSAVASIVLNDAQGSPVAHTFIPLGPDQKGTWWFEDQTGPSPVGYGRLSLQLVRSAVPAEGQDAGGRTARIKLGIHTPKLETLGNTANGLTPPNTVAYVPRCNVEYIISERAVLQDRKDLRKYAQFLMADTQVVAMVESLQNIF